MHFEHFLPTRIIFGAGRIAEIGNEARAFGRVAVMVFGNSASRNGVLDHVRAFLNQVGVATVLAPTVGADPEASQVDAIISAVRQSEAALIVAIGGGSVMDAAKAAGAAIAYEGGVASLVGRTLERNNRALPVVVIPTTAGTGAEVTRGAIIIDAARGLKSGIRGDDIQPRIAICDSDLLATMPPMVAADTIFDAFAHLVETAVVQKATPISQALSRAGLQRLHNITQRDVDLSDSSVRDGLAFAALIGGINIATAGSGLPHRIQQAMGSVRDVHCAHGRALSLIYSAWLPRAKNAAPERFRLVAELLGIGDLEAAFEQLRERLGLPEGLRTVGYHEQHLPTILQNLTGNIENDPIPNINKETIVDIIMGAL